MRLSFDRGTLLLHGFSDPNNAIGLPGVCFDPRVGLPRSLAVHYADLARELVRGGHVIDDGVSAQRLSPPAVAREPELRPYQRAALMAWELSGRRGVLVMPTGSGKTRVALAAIAALRVPTLVLAPTRALLHQWRSELSALGSAKVGVLGDGEREIAPLTIATFESAYRLMPQIGARFELLIVDEVHHFGRAMRDEALEACAAPLRLGLTATPTDEIGAARLDELVGPVVYQLSVGELAGRFLAELQIVVLRLPLDAEERGRHDADQRLFRSVHREFVKLFPNATWQDFVKTCSGSDEGRAALAAWRRNRSLTAFTTAKSHAVGRLLERHRSSRVLVFTADNESAYAIARRELVMPITCDIGRREREWALAAFRAGELGALVSARVLNEGIDVPDADVAIVVAGTLGEREHVQRVGRLLRPAPGKRALVYELVTTGTSEARSAFQRRRALGTATASVH